MGRLRRHVALLAALVVGAVEVECLELSEQQLTNISITGSSSTSTLSFAFYSGDALVTTLSAAELAQESVLLLQNNSLTSIPAELFQAAYNVTSINISSNPLTELKAKSFVNMPRLERVLCMDTQIQVLPSYLASGCPMLDTLVFNQSAIHTIESQALVNLPALRTLDLSYNRLETVARELFMVSSSWKALNFAHNGILTVPSGIKNAVAEGYISFDYNSLVEIDEKAFDGASQIQELRLASNAIFTVNSDAFSGMTALRKLDLSDNVISVIDKNAFGDVDGLEELKLGQNYIHRLTLSSVPTQLTHLELQDNLLDLMPDFPDGFLASQLVYLNMSRNYLWSIATNDALSPYTGLVTLDFSRNRLVNFSSALFDPIMATIEAM
ncbi:Protein-l-isoaspartate O-methyltransferase [Phytophthora boehmeriae]|uniref:Protein-l-isoaspartate O-methyltransferase n=1 Tax=Phytophthora boehmeriae TaxID=109152 RepID=A0A8T1WM16_9STRA|nr:Protein-l-isoaspartate O-methyltransferase [Phytophthora boehmeriae]